jgi:hypothetical protein
MIDSVPGPGFPVLIEEVDIARSSMGVNVERYNTGILLFVLRNRNEILELSLSLSLCVFTKRLLKAEERKELVGRVSE